MKRIKLKRTNSRGSILVAMLVFIVVSFVGISLLGHVVTHQRILKAKMSRVNRMEPVYQELLLYLHQLKERVTRLNITGSQEPELELFNRRQFPDMQVGDITITNHFSHSSDKTGTYRTISILDRVEASSSSNPYLFVAGFEIDILAGKIPLGLIPLYLKQDIETPTTSFLEDNNITIDSPSGPIIDDSPQSFDATAFLSDSLDIEGRMLNWMKVRERLGFDINSDPIPDGVYFFYEDRELESIFVQGTVERMIFAARHNRQFVMFSQNGIDYSISYIPETYAFESWDSTFATDTLFREKIIVNGDCLGVEQMGDAAFHKESDIKLFVSGKTVIKSSLISETDQLHRGKTGWTHMTIISGSHKLRPDACGEPALVVDSEGETRLELSLLINGKITNHSRLLLDGSLFALELTNNGSININHLFPQFNDGAHFLTKNVTIIHKMIINYIQEVTNGNK